MEVGNHGEVSGKPPMVRAPRHSHRMVRRGGKDAMGRIAGAVIIVVVAIIVAAAVAVIYGSMSWNRSSDASFARLLALADTTPVTGLPTTFSREQLDSLPAPVRRYFGRVLIPSQRMIRLAYIDHEGEFALKPNQWQRFTSRQLYTTAPRGFVWDADIHMLPFMPVRVRDRYAAGSASMLATMAGVIKVVDQEGTPGLASGALLRFIAEAAWLPTALLPSEGVRWSAIDDSTARATVSDAGIEVTMDVHFGAEGEISRITAMRERDVNGTSVLTPWVGEMSRELMVVSGVKIPVSASVKWVAPEGEHAYWRGRVRGARFEFR